MKQSLGLVLRGFCMGVADIIPGVSGGTMALILGIYQRLLQSIAALDHRILGDLTRKSFYARILSRVRTPLSPPSENAAEARADAVAFLVVLFAGIASAIVTASRFIPGWMATYPELMRGFFLRIDSGVGPRSGTSDPGATLERSRSDYCPGCTGNNPSSVGKSHP